MAALESVYRHVWCYSASSGRLFAFLGAFLFYWSITGKFVMSQATSGGAYNFASMGLAATCDFEWSMCGWTQEVAPQDQLDFRRNRGVGGTGWYKIQGDHTPGKDACKRIIIL